MFENARDLKGRNKDAIFIHVFENFCGQVAGLNFEQNLRDPNNLWPFFRETLSSALVFNSSELPVLAKWDQSKASGPISSESSDPLL